MNDHGKRIVRALILFGAIFVCGELIGGGSMLPAAVADGGSNTCVGGPFDGSSCGSDLDCGQCASSPSSCSMDVPCPGTCSIFDSPCNTSADCPPLFLCLGGPGPVRECSSDKDCEIGDTCTPTPTDCVLDSCNSGTCEAQPEGACCFPDLSCTAATQGDCDIFEGTYQGDGTDCLTTVCPDPVGACCLSGDCTTATEVECVNLGGDYQGDGTDCQVTFCPIPMGACCPPFGGGCFVTDPNNCFNGGGTYQGDDTICEDCATCPPPGDDCDFLALVSDGITSGCTNTATPTFGGGCDFNGSPDVFLGYEATCTGVATARTGPNLATDFDTTLAVFDGCPGSEIISNDDSFSSFESDVSWEVTQGSRWTIRIAGSGGDTGNYELELFCEPQAANDRCADAREWPIGRSILTNLSGTTPEGIQPCTEPESHDVWYTVTNDATCTRDVTVTTCEPETDFDTILTLKDGCGGNTIALNDDAPCPSGNHKSTITRSMAPGETWWVQVRGFGQATGTYALTTSAEDCPCVRAHEPAAAFVESENRYLSIVPSELDAGRQTAIRVRLTSLHAPDLPPVGTPDFSAFEGEYRWLGWPTSQPETADPDGPTFFAARLQCEPHFGDWSGFDRVAVYGTEVVPSSTYSVDTVDSTCSGSLDQDASYSAGSLQISTPYWGDVVSPFWTPEFDQPDVLDILEIVDKFLGTDDALPKSTTQLLGVEVDPSIKPDLNDILLCVDSFLGKAYPYDAIEACP